VASENGHDRIVEELLNREADVNHQEKVRSLLLYVFLQYYDMYSEPFLKVILGQICGQLSGSINSVRVSITTTQVYQ